MTPYVAFVRNIMQGRRGLTKDMLVQAFVQAGATEAVTHLTTGNVSFRLDKEQPALFRRKVEHALEAILGKKEPVFVYSLGVLSRIDFDGIFGNYACEEVYERCITFTDGCFFHEEELPVRSANKDVEIIRIDGSFIFSITRLQNNKPGGPNKWVERQSGKPASTRNINTVKRVLKCRAQQEIKIANQNTVI